MSYDPKEADREVIAHWRHIQAIMALFLLVNLLGPVMWGTAKPVADGGIGFVAIAKGFGIVLVFCAVMGEIGRRWLNFWHGKRVCKWGFKR